VAPISWRDVHALLTEHDAKSEKAHVGIEKRLRALEDAELLRRGQRQGEAKVLGLAKGSLALLVSIISGLGALLALVR
jgi:hypothetical protein